MDKYQDSFDVEEFKRFRKFNNEKERKTRHIDSFFLDNPELNEEEIEEIIKLNLKKLLEDTKKQIEDGDIDV